MHYPAKILNARHQVVVLRNRHGRAGDIGFLEGIRAYRGSPDLAGYRHHRHRVHHRGRQAGDQVRSTRT